MKVELVGSQPKQPKDKPFPKLMKCFQDGEVILFESYGQGMVIIPSDAYSTGHYSNVWIMSTYTDYTGPVIGLSND